MRDAVKAMVMLMGVVGVCLAVVVGCQSPGQEVADQDKLTREEYVALVDSCRAVLLNSKIVLTAEQREFIRTQPPKFNARYVAPKEGKYVLAWEVPGGLGITVAGEGKFLDRSCRIRVAVVHF